MSAKEGKSRIVRLLASSTRAYSKVILRLRLQAEMEATLDQQEAQSIRSRSASPLVRAQNPPRNGGAWKKTFHSPLYRIGHAPLLRVFVPSPEGPWLSDASVLACEKELKRAGIVQLLKVGDVVWDTAVSDEAGFGNVGRLIWDGNYLIVSGRRSERGADVDRSAGLGLYLFHYRGCPALPSQPFLPSRILSQGAPFHREPHYANGPSSVGEGDCFQLAARPGPCPG